MKRTSRMAFAILALLPMGAFAQSATACPSLPASDGLRWERLDGPGFVFCKALRADGSEAFAVTVSADSPFEPTRRNRAEQASIAGRSGYWYRSEIAAAPNEIARETLVEVDAQHVAHISLRATSEEQKAEAMRQVQGLQFQDALLSSN